MRGCGKHALRALAVAGAALACGDPGDIEVPWAPGVAMRETRPVFPRVPARAFAKFDIADASDGSCLVHFSSSLGQPCAALDTDNATCVPVRDGEGASVSCTVRPLVNVPGVYDLQLDLQHEFLPALAVTGPLDAARFSRVALHVTTPNGTRLDADCGTDTLAVQAGSARFRSSGCTTRIADLEAPGCEVRLTAGVEDCGG